MEPKERIIRYCKIPSCGNKIEDKSRSNNKKCCSFECTKKAKAAYLKRYWLKYKAKNIQAYKERLIREMVERKVAPKWRCQECGDEQDLDFDPRRWQNTKKLMALFCPACNYIPSRMLAGDYLDKTKQTI